MPENKSNSQGAGGSAYNGPDSFLRRNWETALIYFGRSSIWEHLEP